MVPIAAHVLALFLSASSSNREGFARIINHSDNPGTVRLRGIDDAGIEYGPVELSLEARAVAHLNSTDLEAGNSQKGLSAGIGDGGGDWRLQLETRLDIELLSYVRTGDGFVSAMHQVVPPDGKVHRVRFFNPASNEAQVSRLRLVNPTAEVIAVTIEGRDDAGAAGPGGAVRLTLEPNTVRTISARALESGDEGLVGALGDGRGKWQLFVSASGAVNVMSLLQSPTGHLSNLSASRRTTEFAGEGCEGSRDSAVDVPDAVLRAALAERLGKPMGEPITRAEMAELTILDARPGTYRRYGDSTLFQILLALEDGGVDVAGVLKRLSATLDGSAQDNASRLKLFLTALEESGLNLRTLSRSLPPGFRVEGALWDELRRLHQAGEDVASILAILLEWFDGSEQRIRSLKGLECATGLQKLDLSLHDISDISPLSGLKSLQELNLLGNEVSDVSPLDGLLALRVLRLSGKRISDVSSLAELTALEELTLLDTEVSDLSSLGELIRLKLADMRFNRISNVSPLAELASLTLLYLNGNQIADVSPLVSLGALQNLDLSENDILDISPLAGLTSLFVLSLGGNPVSDISPISNLGSLFSLDLWGNGISDISTLSSLGSLSILRLSDNRISDISPLTGLTSLYRVDLSANEISDVLPLAGLALLSRAWLGENRISDVGPLVSGASPQLVILDVRRNPLNSTSRSSHVPSLRDRGVLVLF